MQSLPPRRVTYRRTPKTCCVSFNRFYIVSSPACGCYTTVRTSSIHHTMLTSAVQRMACHPSPTFQKRSFGFFLNFVAKCNTSPYIMSCMVSLDIDIAFFCADGIIVFEVRLISEFEFRKQNFHRNLLYIIKKIVISNIHRLACGRLKWKWTEFCSRPKPTISRTTPRRLRVRREIYYMYFVAAEDYAGFLLNIYI